MTVRMTIKPASLDTIVASNLHADILLILQPRGPVRWAPRPRRISDPERRFPSMFEPIHRSAHDIAGKGVANPIGSFWTASLMLDHLGERVRPILMRAIERVTADPALHTPDLGGSATTRQVTDGVLAAIGRENW